MCQLVRIGLLMHARTLNSNLINLIFHMFFSRFLESVDPQSLEAELYNLDDFQEKKYTPWNPKNNLSINIDPVESPECSDHWGNPSPLPIPRHPRVPAMKPETPQAVSPLWSPNPLKKILGNIRTLSMRGGLSPEMDPGPRYHSPEI